MPRLRGAAARWSRPVWLASSLVGGAVVVLCLAALFYVSGRWALALAALYPVARSSRWVMSTSSSERPWWSDSDGPAAWSFVLLTKVTPGVGLGWFAVRREWRSLAIAIGVTAAIAAASFLWEPGDWFAWIQFLWSATPRLYDGVLPVPLPIRLAVAAALTIWGARSNRPWVLPIAVGLSIPIPYLSMAGTMVCAIGARPLPARRGLPDRAPTGMIRREPASSL